MQNKTAHHLTIHHLSSTDVCTVHDRRAVVFAKAKLLVISFYADKQTRETDRPAPLRTILAYIFGEVFTKIRSVVFFYAKF